MLMCPILLRVNWAGDAIGAAIEHMGVDHGGLDFAMPHQLLDGT